MDSDGIGPPILWKFRQFRPSLSQTCLSVSVNEKSDVQKCLHSTGLIALAPLPWVSMLHLMAARPSRSALIRWKRSWARRLELRNAARCLRTGLYRFMRRARMTGFPNSDNKRELQNCKEPIY